MTAIATDAMKFRFADLFFNEIKNATDSSHYYIGIGKGDQYDSADDTTVNPSRVRRDEREARYNLESIIKVAENNMTYTAPRVNWISGTVYSAYDDNQVGYPTNPFYVLTEDQQVYICLSNNRNSSNTIQPSTVKPSYSAAGTGIHKTFKTADGYVWKFLYELTVAKIANFLSSGWLPVGMFDSSTASVSAENDQAAIRKTTKPGQITGIEIVDAGEGYSSAPTLTIVGDGTAASGTVTLNGNAVGKIDMTNVVADSGMGSGYKFARATLTGGGTPTRPAVLRPILTPFEGIGFDPRQDLKSSSMMFNAKPYGVNNNTFSVTTTGTFGGQSDFRQITLLRNLDYVDSAATGVRVEVASARTSKVIRLTSKPAFVKDEKITGASSGTIGHVDHIDSNGSGKLQLHYHFNYRSDFKHGNFTTNEVVQGGTYGVSGTVDSDLYLKQSTSLGAIDKYSGEVLYIDNRARIVRDVNQTEDIKIILTV